MAKATDRILLIVLISCFSFSSWSQFNPSEESILVTMRMIGHEVLLSSGDSTSKVLPVTVEDERYKIQFESPFSFQPDHLAFIVDSLISISKLASEYTVEVKDCDSGLVVYSYQVGNVDFVPCAGRIQEEGCYIIYVRIVRPMMPFDNLKDSQLAAEKESESFSSIIYYVLIGFIMAVILIFFLNRKLSKKGSHLINIGSFYFDHRNMILIKGKDKQELTGKESDLLQLLYNHLNSTVDRDIILREVWKDEGAYIGRTLDVYISKLRKKFEADPAVNFINVRGVGYKMTLK